MDGSIHDTAEISLKSQPIRTWFDCRDLILLDRYRSERRRTRTITITIRIRMRIRIMIMINEGKIEKIYLQYRETMIWPDVLPSFDNPK